MNFSNNNMNYNNIPLNKEQFMQFAPNLNDNLLNQLAAMARSKGVSENDIQAGLNFIKQMR